MGFGIMDLNFGRREAFEDWNITAEARRTQGKDREL